MSHATNPRTQSSLTTRTIRIEGIGEFDVKGEEALNIELFDTSGNLIYRKQSNEHMISMPSGLVSGIYLMRLSNRDNNITQKTFITIR